MENDSRNSPSASNNKPIKTFSHYLNKFFRHTKKRNSTTNVLTGSSDSLSQSARSGISMVQNGKFSSDISRVQILCNVDEINEGNAPETPALGESNSVSNADVVNIQIEESYEQIENEDDIPLQQLSTEYSYGGQQFAVEYLPNFCDKLHNLVEIVKNILADSSSLIDYPRQLQSDLVKEAKELDILYAEIRCIQTTIDRVKYQRDIIRNGKISALEQQSKLEEEEIKEIEKSIAFTEKPLLKSWERIKRCRTPEAFDNLLMEVHRNLEVLKNLEVLIQNKKNKATCSDLRPIHDSRLVNSILTGNIFEVLNL